jgi:hypothetical protein
VGSVSEKADPTTAFWLGVWLVSTGGGSVVVEPVNTTSDLSKGLQ